MSKRKNMRKLKAEIRAIEAVNSLGKPYTLSLPLSDNDELLVDDVREFRDGLDLNSRDCEYKHELSFRLEVDKKLYKIYSIHKTLD